MMDFRQSAFDRAPLKKEKGRAYQEHRHVIVLAEIYTERER